MLRLGERGRRTAAIAVAVLGVLALAVGAVAADRRIEDRSTFVQDQWETFKRSQATESGSSHLVNLGSNRYDFWRVSLAGFEEHPLAGIGGRGFGPRYLQYGDSYETPARAHSLPLDALLETGLVGLILLLAAFAAILAGVVRRLSTVAGAAAFGALVYFAVHAAGDWVWTFPAVGLPLFALVGIALAPVGGRALTGRTRGHRRRSGRALRAGRVPAAVAELARDQLGAHRRDGGRVAPLGTRARSARGRALSRRGGGREPPRRGDPTARARRREGAARGRSPVPARQGVPRGGTGRRTPALSSPSRTSSFPATRTSARPSRKLVARPGNRRRAHYHERIGHATP